MKRPLSYFYASLFIGCIVCFCILNNNIILGAVFTASFFVLLFYSIEKQYLVVLIIFFFMGLLNYYIYFKVNINDSRAIKIRVLEKKEHYSIGSINKRKVIIKSNNKNLQEGKIIFIKGYYKSEPNYVTGAIGVISICKIYKTKTDFKTYIYNLKNNLHNKLSRLIGNEKTAIIMSLCFGETRYLTQGQSEDLKNLGVIHAVSVSGFHVGVICKLLQYVFSFYVSSIILLFYVIFTGAKASTVRAFIMIIVLGLSKKVYKNYDAISALSLSAIIILVWQPYNCFNIGFNLSFLATLSILLFYKKLNKALYKLPTKLNNPLSLTLSAQILVFPYLISALGSFSMGFILGNIVLIPIYSIIVILGNMALIFSKINIIFNALVYILNIVVNISIGITNILKIITPSASNFQYVYSIIVIFTYIIYFLYKKGYKRVKYLPPFMLIILLINRYNFVPYVRNIQYGITNITEVSYKDKSILLCKSMEDVKESIRIRKNLNTYSSKIIKLNNKTNNAISFSNNFKIKILKNNKNKIKMILMYNNRKFIFTNENEFTNKDNKNNNCDIIFFNDIDEKCNYYNSFNQEYIIIFDRVYKVRDKFD